MGHFAVTFVEGIVARMYVCIVSGRVRGTKEMPLSVRPGG